MFKDSCQINQSVVWFQSLNLLCIFKSPLGGEVAGSEGGETTPAAGGAPAEGEEGKDAEVVYYRSQNQSNLTITLE